MSHRQISSDAREYIYNRYWPLCWRPQTDCHCWLTDLYEPTDSPETRVNSQKQREAGMTAQKLLCVWAAVPLQLFWASFWGVRWTNRLSPEESRKHGEANNNFSSSVPETTSFTCRVSDIFLQRHEVMKHKYFRYLYFTWVFFSSDNFLLVLTFKHTHLYFLLLTFSKQACYFSLKALVFLPVLRTLYQPKISVLTFL